MSSRKEIATALSSIFEGISHLKDSFPSRQFTIDGRLVGDIGEVIAALVYQIELDDISQPRHDGTTINGRRVQVKATFQDELTFKSVPDYYLGIKLYEDGRFEEVFNGPGIVIFNEYSHRAGIGETLLRFPNKRLKELSEGVADDQRIPKRDENT